MAKVNVTVSISEELVAAIDARAASRGVTRSAWVAKAAEFLLSQGTVKLTYTDVTTKERTVHL